MKSVFAKNLRSVRNKKGWTQVRAAKVIGINRSALGAYEEGRATPPPDTLIKITDAYGIRDIRKFLTENYLIKDQPSIHPTVLETKYRLLEPMEKKIVDLIFDNC